MTLENGLILLDKEAGMSSAQAIAKVKKKLSLKKIGHSGTLDPFATGLLVCLIGRATKVASYAESGEKIYSGIIKFGMQTSTDDITGEVTSTTREIPSLEEIKNILPNYIGEILQTPPKVSAIKIEGERAYDMVREGKDVELSARSVFVKKFELENYSDGELEFKIQCAKGTYIRAIARDMGNELKCGACLKTLRREASFPFYVDDAKRIDNITSQDIVNWTKLFPNAEHVSINDFLIAKLQNGNKGTIASFQEKNKDKPYVILQNTALNPVGLLIIESGKVIIM